MKRTPLMRRTSLKRGTPLKRGGFLRRRQPWRSGVVAAEWRAGIGACVRCGSRRNVDGHHAIPARILRMLGLHAYLSDRRNRVDVCRDCHESHENRSKPLTREELPAAVWEFAAELGLTWYLEKHYPSRKALAA